MGLDTGIGSATTTSPGVVLKAADLTAVAPTPLANNTTGAASSTLAPGGTLPTVPILSDVITALLALIGVVNNNFASTNTQLNAISSRVEDLIAKQKTAGQQT